LCVRCAYLGQLAVRAINFAGLLVIQRSRLLIADRFSHVNEGTPHGGYANSYNNGEHSSLTRRPERKRRTKLLEPRAQAVKRRCDPKECYDNARKEKSRDKDCE
jgi:hypothetical protein